MSGGGGGGGGGGGCCGGESGVRGGGTWSKLRTTNFFGAACKCSSSCASPRSRQLEKKAHCRGVPSCNAPLWTSSTG